MSERSGVERSEGIFLEFHYSMISINILLCNSNLIHSEIFFFCSRGRRQFVELR